MTVTLRVLFFLGDLLFLNLSMILSQYLGQSQPNGINFVYLVIFSNLSWLFLVMVSTPYNVSKGWTVSKIAKSQVAFVFIHLLVVAALVFFFRQQYTVFQITLIYLIFIPFFFVLRVVSFYVRKFFIADIITKNYVLVGRNELARETRKFYLMNPGEGYKFMGYLDFDPSNLSVSGLQTFCVERNVQEIFYCAPDVAGDALKGLINFGLDSLIKVKVITSNSAGRTLQLDQFDHQPGRGVVTVALDSFRNQLIKRTFDMVFSFFFCVLVLSWLIPLIGLLIKLESKGPVFFVQLRNGESNKPFKCIKFRTMVQNQEADNVQASRNDSRVTKFGSFLRKSSIDELPQFINVLWGNMSMIGPRPHPIKLNEKFSPLITNIMSRHYVKPGITGLAQCMGYRGETSNVTDMENRFKLDRYYIENWTFWLDIKIIFLTIVSLIRGSDKAY
jgi:putative colanic acid biosynthesis UDP-glucose lipid carrier transferase